MSRTEPTPADPHGPRGPHAAWWSAPRAAWRSLPAAGAAALAALTRLAAAPAVAPAAVVALAALVRLAGLGSPASPLVDEPYYVGGARSLLARGYEPTYRMPVPGELPAVHPPLGKWLISLGILALGDRPVGWRIAAALAGTATVALVYLCARRLFPGRFPAIAAALLLAVEDLSVVQSRTAMLDGFLAFWLVAAVYALLRDRDEVRAGAPGSRPARRRPWRLAAGVMLGCALATKWSGAFVLPVAWLLVLAWETRRRADPAAPRPAPAALTAALRDELPSVVATLVFVPIGVYLLSYAGTFLAGGDTLATWWVDQLKALDFHATLNATHPYQSSALSWLVMRRPMVYFYTDAPGPGGVREVLALGHPLLFLAIVPTVAWAAARWWRAHDHALAVPLLLALALWLPWLPQDRPMFIYYMTPVLPFVALLQGAALARLAHARTWLGPALAYTALAAAVALFWFHWPILTGIPLTDHAWALRVANWRRIPLLRFNWV
jgi:dolichyl-phosphate-mannose--protein O-mannosyl transferase